MTFDNQRINNDDNWDKTLIDLENNLSEMIILSKNQNIDFSLLIKRIRNRYLKIKHNLIYSLNSQDRLSIARHKKRPTTLDYINLICSDWIELHGDYIGFDDKSIIAGLAKINDVNVVIIGHQKGRDTKENIFRNFAMASPSGYRKALRLMKHANKFNMPIITFVDTPGASAGFEAEKSGQGRAIALNLREMFSLTVPLISVIIGEGGSGGALGISVSNYIMMLENAVYTVATPEACASILWKDVTKAIEASESLKISAQDLLALDIIDEIIFESCGAAHQDPPSIAKQLKERILDKLHHFDEVSPCDIKDQRYKKFRKIGFYYEIN
uniref:Acetyl-coenzyme A carboxylase carboxyl transferase subunit alpha n=1 Tax=Cyanidium sp. THAL103 TaxID=3027999 RepID=A0A9Y1I421_9RHOD|nr:acetyl-CoA carboxylase carboxyltransferase alphasubunit [Cyanidium sp. THAL103]